MAEYVESGLRVTLPDGEHFRFDGMAAYQSVKGGKVKEMDFAWIDQGKLHLLEVRSYVQVTTTLTSADFVPARALQTPYRFEALIDKITDSTRMLLAAWANTSWGDELKNDLPLAAKTRLPLKLIVAIELPSQLTVHLPALRDALNARLRGRLAIADISQVALLDYTRLTSHPAFRGYFSTL